MNELDRLRDRIRSLPNDRLARMVGPDRRLYSPDALVVAEVEAEARGVHLAPGELEDPRSLTVRLHPDDEIDDAFDAEWDRFTDRVRAAARWRPDPRPAPAPGTSASIGSVSSGPSSDSSASDSPASDGSVSSGSTPYAALGGAGAAFRWLALAFAAYAALALGLGGVSLVAGSFEGVFASVAAAFWAGFGALGLFGGSELVRLALDVEARTRHLAPPRPPDASPTPGGLPGGTPSDDGPT